MRTNPSVLQRTVIYGPQRSHNATHTAVPECYLHRTPPRPFPPAAWGLTGTRDCTLRIGRFSWFAWNTALLQRPAILDRAIQVADDLSNETPGRGEITRKRGTALYESPINMEMTCIISQFRETHQALVFLNHICMENSIFLLMTQKSLKPIPSTP